MMDSTDDSPLLATLSYIKNSNQTQSYMEYPQLHMAYIRNTIIVTNGYPQKLSIGVSPCCSSPNYTI